MSDNPSARAFGVSTTTPASTSEEVPRRQGLFSVGEVLASSYEIKSVLGSGGMATVYEAEDLTLKRRVAIKASFAHIDATFLIDEARALASIRHPGLAVIHAFGAHQGIPFVVMECILGTPLDTHLKRRAAERSRMTVEEAIDVLLALTEVLAALHGAGIVHRDVKPGNIMLAPGGRVVLMDFGLSVPESRTTDNSAPVGTPRYMAPETVTGDVEARTAYFVDIYALGVLAFELVVGETPFGGDTLAELLTKHVAEAPRKLSALRDDVPKALSALVDQMLAKDPVERPSSMEAIGFRLRQLRARGTAPQEEAPLVLIVEDDDAMARMLDLLVKKAMPGARIERASNGMDGMRIASAHEPMLMLLDLHMPKMSGIELGMYLRGAEIARTCTIVAVSAGASEGDLALLRELGVTRFIQKGSPRFNDQIVAEARRVLGS